MKKKKILSLVILSWIKAKERDSGLIVTAVTSLWIICSLRLCEMPAWRWCSDLLLFSHGDKTQKDSEFAGSY